MALRFVATRGHPSSAANTAPRLKEEGPQARPRGLSGEACGMSAFSLHARRSELPQIKAYAIKREMRKMSCKILI
jgi:hypothetical protein